MGGDQPTLVGWGWTPSMGICAPLFGVGEELGVKLLGSGSPRLVSKMWGGPKEPGVVPKNLGWSQRAQDDPQGWEAPWVFPMSLERSPRSGMIPKSPRWFPEKLGGTGEEEKNLPLGTGAANQGARGEEGPLVVDVGQDPQLWGGWRRLPAHRDWSPFPKPISVPPRGVQEAQGGLSTVAGGPGTAGASCISNGQRSEPRR